VRLGKLIWLSSPQKVVPLQNLVRAVDLQVKERSESGMIVGRVFPTSLSDHGVRVPVAGGPGVQQVRRVGPPAAATAADEPAGHAGHVAVLAPAPGGP
jgi:hypothetical protein